MPSSAMRWWRTHSLRAGGWVGIGLSSSMLASELETVTDGMGDMGDGSGSGTMMGASKVVTGEGETGGGVGLGEREHDLPEARRGGGRVSQT